MAKKRPTQKDVFNAFYEGVCAVLSSSNVMGGLDPNILEVDREEFRDWLHQNGDFPDIAKWLNEA